MRQLAFAMAWIAWGGAALGADSFLRAPFGKFPAGGKPAPNCVTPAPRCGVPGHPSDCGCRPPCNGEKVPQGGPSAKEIPEQLQYLPRETGAYVAPPRVGSTRGAMVQRGIEGGAITFPEIRLKLPCIELPARFVSRSQARMHVESAIAPWESHGVVNGAAAGNEALLLRRIAELEQALESKSGAAAPADSAAELAAKEKAAAEDYARKLDEYQRLLEQCQKQQEELRECIRKCLEQHPGGSGPLPAGKDYHPSPAQKPIADPHPGAYYPPAPEVDPNARLLPPVYAERPASFTSERPLAAAPRPLIIQEPQRPSGRITGLRPVE